MQKQNPGKEIMRLGPRVDVMRCRSSVNSPDEDKKQRSG